MSVLLVNRSQAGAEKVGAAKEEVPQRRPKAKALGYQLFSSLSSANRHGMVKDIVGIVAPFDSLQERVHSLVAVVELRPEGIGQHILIRIVDVAALVAVARVGCSAVASIDVGACVHLAIEVGDPGEMACLVLLIAPVALVLELQDGAALVHRGGRRQSLAVAGSSVGVDRHHAGLQIGSWDGSGHVLVDALDLGRGEAALHVGGFVLASASAGASGVLGGGG